MCARVDDVVGGPDVPEIAVKGILILADDLSGAADCGIACRMRGLDTVVLWGEHLEDSADAIAIDAGTRSLAAADAAAVFERLGAGIARGSGRVVFKKLDSLLRGHIGVELAALHRVLAPALLLVAPALPALGRTTLGGRQYLDGQPIRGADARGLLQSAGLAAGGVDRRSAGEIARLAGTYDAVVCDAASEDDLCAIARAGVALQDRGVAVIWAGSSGLAWHLPESLGYHGRSAIARPRFEGPVLTVSGSRTALTRRQIEEAAEGRDVVTLTPDVLRNPGMEQSERLKRTLALGRDAFVRIEGSEGVPEDPELASALGRWIRPHLDHAGAWILTGGETARAVLDVAGIRGLRLVDEMERGVPLSLAGGPRPIPVVTKSGSFGGPGTLRHCLQQLESLKLK